MAAEENFKCVFCKKSFNDKETLQEHFRQHGDPTQHSNMKKNKSKQPESQPSTTDTELISCDVCPEVFTTISKVITHKHKVHPEYDAKHFCLWCGKLFTVKHLYEKHLKTHESLERLKETFPCDCCGVEFYLPSAMLHHNKFFHRQESGLTVFSSSKQKFVNKEIVPLYYCSFCGEEYMNIVNLHKHVTEDHSEENQSPDSVLRCPLCEAIFYHLDAYDLHLTFHSKDDIYCGSQGDKTVLEEYTLETVPPIDEKVQSCSNPENDMEAMGIDQFLELAMESNQNPELPSTSEKHKHKKHKKQKKSKKAAITLDEFLSMNQDVFGEGLDFHGVEEVPTQMVAKQLKKIKNNPVGVIKPRVKAIPSADLQKLKQQGVIVKVKSTKKPHLLPGTKITTVKSMPIGKPNKLSNNMSGATIIQTVTQQPVNDTLTKLMNQTNNQLKIVKKTKDNDTGNISSVVTENSLNSQLTVKSVSSVKDSNISDESHLLDSGEKKTSINLKQDSLNAEDKSNENKKTFEKQLAKHSDDDKTTNNVYKTDAIKEDGIEKNEKDMECDLADNEDVDKQEHKEKLFLNKQLTVKSIKAESTSVISKMPSKIINQDKNSDVEDKNQVSEFSDNEDNNSQYICKPTKVKNSATTQLVSSSEATVKSFNHPYNTPDIESDGIDEEPLNDNKCIDIKSHSKSKLFSNTQLTIKSTKINEEIKRESDNDNKNRVININPNSNNKAVPNLAQGDFESSDDEETLMLCRRQVDKNNDDIEDIEDNEPTEKMFLNKQLTVKSLTLPKLTKHDSKISNQKDITFRSEDKAIQINKQNAAQIDCSTKKLLQNSELEMKSKLRNTIDNTPDFDEEEMENDLHQSASQFMQANSSNVGFDNTKNKLLKNCQLTIKSTKPTNCGADIDSSETYKHKTILTEQKQFVDPGFSEYSESEEFDEISGAVVNNNNGTTDTDNNCKSKLYNNSALTIKSTKSNIHSQGVLKNVETQKIVAQQSRKRQLVEKNVNKSQTTIKSSKTLFQKTSHMGKTMLVKNTCTYEGKNVYKPSSTIINPSNSNKSLSIQLHNQSQLKPTSMTNMLKNTETSGNNVGENYNALVDNFSDDDFVTSDNEEIEKDNDIKYSCNSPTDKIRNNTQLTIKSLNQIKQMPKQSSTPIKKEENYDASEITTIDDSDEDDIEKEIQSSIVHKANQIIQSNVYKQNATSNSHKTLVKQSNVIMNSSKMVKNVSVNSRSEATRITEARIDNIQNSHNHLLKIFKDVTIKPNNQSMNKLQMETSDEDFPNNEFDAEDEYGSDDNEIPQTMVSKVSTNVKNKLVPGTIIKSTNALIDDNDIHSDEDETSDTNEEEVSANHSIVDKLKNTNIGLSIKSIRNNNSNDSESSNLRNTGSFVKCSDTAVHKPGPLKCINQNKAIQGANNTNVSQSQTLETKTLQKFHNANLATSTTNNDTVNREVSVKTFQTQTVIEEITTTVTKTIRTVNQSVNENVSVASSNQSVVKVKGTPPVISRPQIQKSNLGARVKPATVVQQTPKQVQMNNRITQKICNQNASLKVQNAIPSRSNQVQYNKTAPPVANQTRVTIGNNKPVKIAPHVIKQMAPTNKTVPNKPGPFSCFKKPKESLIPVADVTAASRTELNATSSQVCKRNFSSSTMKVVKSSSMSQVTSECSASTSSTSQQLSRLSNNSGLKIIKNSTKQVQTVSEKNVVTPRNNSLIEKLQQQGLLVKKPRLEESDDDVYNESDDEIDNRCLSIESRG